MVQRLTRVVKPVVIQFSDNVQISLNYYFKKGTGIVYAETVQYHLSQIEHMLVWPVKKLKQHSCANCGFEFSANVTHTNYCHIVPENHNPRFPLVHYGYELLETFLHFDTKFSIHSKFYCSGQDKYHSTISIISGGRYTPPFRLFIFISIFCFAHHGCI